MFFVIEHLEPEVSRWLYIEYSCASKIVGGSKLIFTNVKNLKDARVLSKLGSVRSESFAEIFPLERIVILDPRASEGLRLKDLEGKEAIIVGGILGDHPARGRTRKLITARVPGVLSRNIGVGQFSIDGAIYMAKLVSEGVRLENIPVREGLRIRLNERAEIHLPYMYPLKNGKPLISNELIRYLTSEGIIRDEEKLLMEKPAVRSKINFLEGSIKT